MGEILFFNYRCWYREYGFCVMLIMENVGLLDYGE